MRQALTLHPDSVCAAVTSLTVDIVRPRPNLLTLDYALSGGHEGERALRLLAEAVEIRPAIAKTHDREARAGLPARAQHAADQPARHLAERRVVERPDIADVESHLPPLKRL